MVHTRFILSHLLYHLLFTFFLSNPVNFISLLSTNHRAEAAGNRPITGDEHTFPLLVIFPARSLQQEDVRGVQTAGRRGRERRIQVRALTSDGWIFFFLFFFFKGFLKV